MFVDYATLEQMLMRLFEIDETQRAALRGRFKYVRPRLLDTESIGRGVARYEVDDILRVVMVLELEDAGYSPMHAIRIVKNHWDDLQGYFGDAWDAVREREAGGSAESLLWAVIPHLLREMGADASEDMVSCNETTGPLAPVTSGAWPRPALVSDRHFSAINLPHLLEACCEALATVGPDVAQRFRGALDLLARETAEQAGIVSGEAAGGT